MVGRAVSGALQSAARPASALQAAVGALAPAPPLVQRRSAAGFVPPLASLAAIPARPVVQRTCEACGEEESEEQSVQPRLEVGAAGDRFEVEADAIAARVMAMAPGEASEAPDTVQRACAACASPDEEARARRLGSEEEAIEAGIGRHPAGSGAGKATIAASQRELTSGGAPLPSQARAFFERRMGRDLSAVRVHQGGGSGALNRSIAARAFTYRNHIWLGSGETASTSFTMAHELAHVLQQTSPGPVGPSAAASGDSEAPIRRTYFYEEDGKALPETHDEVVNFLTRVDNLIYAELPVPNASARGLQSAKKRFGRSDLVKISPAKSSVPIGFASQVCPPNQQGAWYCAPGTGRGLKRPTSLDEAVLDGEKQDIIHNGTVWSGQDTLSRPRYGKKKSAVPPNGFVRDAGGQERFAEPTVTNPSDTDPSPVSTNFHVGDVKAAAFESAGLKAPRQVTNYLDGFKGAHDLYESIRLQVKARRAEMKRAGANDFSSLPPFLTPWEVKTGVLADIEGVDPVQKVKRNTTLKLKQWVGRKSVDVPKSAPETGDLFMWKEVDVAKGGAWSYIWVPQSHPGPQMFDKLTGNAPFQEHSKTARCLREALALKIEPSGKPSPAGVASLAPDCLQPMRASAAAPAVRRAPPRKPPAPTPPVREDPFALNYDKWKKKRTGLRQDYESFSRSEAGEKRGAMLAALDARKFIRESMPPAGPIGKVPTALSDEGVKVLEAQRSAEFWIELFGSQAGERIGGLRHRFGRVFVKLVGAYESAKAKIDQKMRDLKGARGKETLDRKALVIVAKILGAAARKILPPIAAALMDCLERGFAKTLDEMFADGPVAELRERIAKAETFARELTEDTVAGIDALGDQIVSSWGAVIEEIKNDAKFLGEMVKTAKDIFDAVRLLICAAGGAESFGLACAVAVADKVLGWLGISPLEKLGESLFSTCMGQTLLAKALMAIQPVQKLPATIAGKIVETVRPRLPAGAQGLLCDPASISVPLPAISEITCGQGGSPAATPGPDAEGKYQKGTWQPPAGHPDDKTRKILDKLEEFRKQDKPAPDPPPRPKPAPKKPKKGPKDQKPGGPGEAQGDKSPQGEGAQPAPDPNKQPKLFWQLEGPIVANKKYNGEIVTVDITLMTEALRPVFGSKAVEIKVYSVAEFPDNGLVDFYFAEMTGFNLSHLEKDPTESRYHFFDNETKWPGVVKRP